MTNEFNVTVLNFDGNHVRDRMPFKTAVEWTRDGRAPSILVDAIPDGEVEAWWNDPAFPELITPHGHHLGIRTSALKQTIGQVQRSTTETFLRNFGDYFTFSSNANQKIRESRFVRFLSQNLGVVPLRFGELSEFLLATKREYPAYEGGDFSFAPHCDAIDFGRDPRWPIHWNKEQIGAFVLIQRSANQAGFVMWDLRVKSRDELDRFASEFAETQEVKAARNVPSLVITPGQGQMCLFNSRYLHAVEKCASPRHTIGTFLIEQDSGWALFN